MFMLFLGIKPLYCLIYRKDSVYCLIMSYRTESQWCYIYFTALNDVKRHTEPSGGLLGDDSREVFPVLQEHSGEHVDFLRYFCFKDTV